MDINLLPNSKKNNKSKTKKQYKQDFEMHIPDDQDNLQQEKDNIVESQNKDKLND